MLPISSALQAALDLQSSPPVYVVELRPKRAEVPLATEIVLDCDMQSKRVYDQTLLVHRRGPPDGVTGSNDETSSSGVTRRVYGGSTVLATEFFGAGSYVRLGEGLALLGSCSFAVEFRADSLHTADLFGVYRVDGTSDVVTVGITSTGYLEATYYTTTVTQSAGRKYEVGRWHTLIATFEAADDLLSVTVTLYLDGELVKTAVAPDLAIIFPPVGVDFFAQIGNDQPLSADFDGRIGRIIVWSLAP